MKLSEDEIYEKYAKQYCHCHQNLLHSYEYERNCFGCGYNVIY